MYRAQCITIKGMTYSKHSLALDLGGCGRPLVGDGYSSMSLYTHISATTGPIATTTPQPSEGIHIHHLFSGREGQATQLGVFTVYKSLVLV